MDKIVYGIVIGFLFIGSMLFFCVILIRLYFTKIKTYTQQLYQKDLDFQKTLTTTVIETQEQVLNNVSEDLHDDVGQQLTIINFQLEHLKLDSPESHNALTPLSESLGKVSQSVRDISHALNNQLIVKQDLLKAITTEMERLQKNTKIAIDFSLPTKAKSAFPVNEKIIIYRIFQESLNNSFKHAKAKAVSVVVKTTPQFQMIITDDGIGFEAAKKTTTSSLGLGNMKTRAASIGYHLTINSTPGTGTTITLTENKTT
jgi:signal transduction histidine kinase